MKVPFSKSLFVLFSALVFSYACQDNSTDKREEKDSSQPLFKLLSPQVTGVYFENTLTEGLNTNILMYEYFYNGGGVATGDLNNDGLVDIYFTSNMSENKLYINQGNLQFQDVTKESGAAGRPGPWKTGVSFADVNGDGLLDIYLCYSGSMPEEKRINELYINQGSDENGIPTFLEKAAEFGLASAAYSNQTYFFDYDQDNDLDLLLLNHNPKSLPIFNEFENRRLIQQDNPLIGVRLFEQNNGTFEDATQKAGISSSELTYGLGLGISDLNNDGWPDFYICNDYSVPDFLYINNQNGTFTNRILESLNHTTLSSMGNDVADINNDGWTDILSLDMLPKGNRRQKLLLPSDSYEKYDLNVKSGFHHQYMRNMLQLNSGNGTYSEIGQLAGISNTDWSWAALFADYNNDGRKDLFISNGYYRDFTNMDFLQFMNSYVSEKGRLIREDVMEIVKKLPTEDVINYMYANQDGLTFSNVTDSWGVNQPSKSNGAAYADLDNDGDLDLIINNINQPAFIYENQSDKLSDHHYLQIKLKGSGRNTHGIGAKVAIYTNGQKQFLEQFTSRGYLSSISPVLHFGLGQLARIDSVIVTWPTGKRQRLMGLNVDQQITLQEDDAALSNKNEKNIDPFFKEAPSPISYQNPKLKKRDFERQPLLISELSHSGPCMEKGDLNGDGLEDIVIGGAKGQMTAIYLQNANQKFAKLTTKAFDEDMESEDTDIAITDVNGDSHPDLYIASGGYHNYLADDGRLQDRLYMNDGKANFVKSKNALPEMRTSTGCIAANDFNGDGFPDLFVGGRLVPGKYPDTPTSYLLINDGKGNFTDEIETLAPELKHKGMITDAVSVDINKDGLQDLIVVGDWLPISIYINQKGKLVDRTDDFFEKQYIGWWNTLHVSDINDDNRPDFIAGNLGTNTQFRASDQEPVEVYYKDFDNSGSIDLIFCYYINGQSHPYLTRDELLKQIVPLRSKFPTYESFAEASVHDIFDKGTLNSAGYLKANHLETSLFLSQPDGKYKLKELPEQAQFAPVYVIKAMDFDSDGNEDILLCGNNSFLKLRLGAIDANYGVLLEGKGDGDFQYVEQLKSGFRIKGDVRSVISTEDYLFFGLNQGSVVTYKKASTIEF